MTEMASQASVGYQDELWIGRTSTGETPTTTLTQILGVETIAMPERTPDDIDVTHQQSPGRSRETIPGLMASADFSQELQFWPLHPSQIMLETLSGFTEAGTEEHVHVVFVVGGITRAYRGYVTSWTPNSAVGEKRTATLAMKLFERILPAPILPT